MLFKLMIIFWLSVTGILTMKDMSFSDLNFEPQIMAELLQYG